MSTPSLNESDCVDPETPRSLRSHFAHPTGWLGALAGHVMAFNNRGRGLWVRSLLEIAPDHDVLEIGFGPGADLRELAREARSVKGIDPSRTMLRQAARRNRDAIAEGRVELRCGSAERLPFADARFDRAQSINNVQFWTSVEAGLTEIRRVLRPGGLAAVAIQPRNQGATEATTRAWAERLEAAAREAGYADVGLAFRDARPVPITCALLRR